MQVIDWNDLQTFMMVARTGQIARAARKMRVDPTTVGRRLRRLESRLLATLFEQTREGQSLTEAGEKLLSAVETMATAADSISRHDEGTLGPSGILRVSVAEGFGSWFLTRHIQDFVARYPKLKLDLVASSGFLSPSKREADIAVILSRPKAGHVVAQKLSTYALRLYASKPYLTEHGVPAQLEEVGKNHRLIGYIPDLIYAPELNYLEEILPGHAPDVRSSSINAQHHFVAAGIGIGVLPCFIGDADPTLTAVIPATSIVRTFWLVIHKDNRSLARVKAGKDWLLDAVRRDVDFLNARI